MRGERTGTAYQEGGAEIERSISVFDRRYAALCSAALLVAVVVYLLVSRAVLPRVLAGQGISDAAYALGVLDGLALRALGVAVVALLVIGAATGRFGQRDRAWLAVASLLVAAVFAYSAYDIISQPPLFEGDAGEYLLMTGSFAAHATPDLRGSDLEAFNRIRVDGGLPIMNPSYGYIPALNGRAYSYHFWAYSLFAAPFWIVLDAIGTSPLKAHSVLNLVLFFASLSLFLLAAKMPERKRAAFVLLLCFSPLAWYVRWPSPELFSAAFVLLSVLAVTRRSWALAVGAAAVASLQNPPLVLLVAFIAGWAMFGPERVSSWKERAGIVAAGAMALLPYGFYQLTFGAPSLVATTGFAAWQYTSLQRVAGVFADLNQGILPYAVAVSVALLAALSWAAVRREAWTLGRIGLLVAMATVIGTIIDANNNSAGLMRWATWLLPIVVWIVLDWADLLSRRRAVVTGLVVLQVANSLMFFSVIGALDHNMLAREVLTRAPRLYAPVPEVFAERTLGSQVPIEPFLPVAFEHDGSITKVLADDDEPNSLQRHFSFAQDLELRPRPAGVAGLYYIDIPRGLMTPQTQESAVASESVALTAVVGGPSQFEAVSNIFNVFPVNEEGLPILSPLAVYPLYAEALNVSDSTWYPAGDRSLGLTVVVSTAGGDEVSRSMEPLRRATAPDETAVFYAEFLTPDTPGEYRITAFLGQVDPLGDIGPISPAVQSDVIVDFRPPTP